MLLAVAVGYVNSQNVETVTAQAKANIALEESKQRIKIYEVFEEESRLLLSILECKIKIDQIRKAYPQQPVNVAAPAPVPVPMADPNTE